MGLAMNFFLMILVELPIIILFFKRKKRQQAFFMALLINIISWAVAHVMLFTTDINIYVVEILVIIGEAIAFNKLLECSWKKAFIMSVVVNIFSFTATQLINTDEMFTPKQEIRTTSLKYLNYPADK